MQINNHFFTAAGGNTAVNQWPQVAPPYVTRYGGSAVNSAAGGLAAQLVTVADSTKGGGGR